MYVIKGILPLGSTGCNDFSKSEPLGSPVNSRTQGDIRGSSGDSPAESRMRGDLHVRFGGRGISRPYYHYAFAMLLGSTLFVTFFRMWDFLSSWVDNRSSFIWIVSRSGLISQSNWTTT